MYPQNPQTPNYPPKSSLLWNVVDPDDAYDIRKSMIARLPDHSTNFMGGNVEMVCLMQAAEIERLTDYLAQFQLKYKELERKELDRHSYEILIKELSQRAGEASKYQKEVEKLRDYIKKLTLELEQVSQSSNSVSAVQGKYEELMKKYQALLGELQNSRETIDGLNTGIAKLLEENKQHRMKYDRLDKLRLTEITQEREKYEIKMRERIELQVKQVESRYTLKIGQYESDCRLYREQLEAKNHELSSLLTRNQGLKRELESREKNSAVEYNNKIAQLQRINGTLSQKASEMEQIYMHYQTLQSRLKGYQQSQQQLQKQNQHLHSTLEKMQQQRTMDEQRDGKIMIELENKTALLSQEIERLMLVIQGRNRDIGALKEEIAKCERQLADRKQYEYIQQLQAQLKPLRQLTIQLKLRNEMLLKELSTASQVSQRITELQTQLKNADLIISEKNEHICGLEARIKIGEGFSSEVVGLKGEVMGLKGVLADVSRFFRGVDDVYGTRCVGGAGQIDVSQLPTLLTHLHNTVQQKQQLRKQLQSQTLTIHTHSMTTKSLQQKLSQTTQSLHKTRNELKQLIRMNQQYENDFRRGALLTADSVEGIVRRTVEDKDREAREARRVLEQELVILRDKVDRKVGEQQQYKLHMETRYLNQIHDLTASLKALRQENERTNHEKSKLKQLLSEAEKELGTKQRDQFEQVRALNQRIQEQKQKYEQLQLSQTRLTQQLSQAKQSLSTTYQECQKRVSAIYTTQLQDKDTCIESLQRQLRNTRDELATARDQEERGRADLKNYRDRLVRASEELDRLNHVLAAKNKEIQGLVKARDENKGKEDDVKRLRADIANIQKQLQSKQEEVNTLKSHITHLQSSHKQQISQKTRQLESLASQLQSTTSVQTANSQLHLQLQELQSSHQEVCRVLDGCRRELLEKETLVEKINRDRAADRDRLERVQRERETKYQGILRDQQAKFETIIREKEGAFREKYDGLFREKETLWKDKEAKYESMLREKQAQIGRERAEKGIRLGHQRDMIQKSLRVEYQSKTRQLQQRESRLHQELTQLQQKNSELQIEISRLAAQLAQAHTSQQSWLSMTQHAHEQEIEIRNLKQMLQQMEDMSAHVLVERDSLFASAHQLQTELEICRARERDRHKQEIGNMEVLKKNINQLNAVCAEYQQQVRKLEKDIESLANRNREYEEQLTMLVPELERLNSILGERDRAIQRYKTEEKASEQSKGALAQMQIQLNQARQELSQVNYEIVTIRNREGQLQSSLSQAQQQLNQIQSQYASLQSQYTALQTHHKTLQTQHTSLQSQHTNLQTQHKTLQNQHTTLQRQHTSLQVEYTSIQNQQTSIKSEYISMQSQYNSIKAECASLQSQLVTLKNQYSSLKSEYTVLQTQYQHNHQHETKFQELQIENRNLKQMLQEMEEMNLHAVAERDQLFQMTHQYKLQVDQLKVQYTAVLDSLRQAQAQVQALNDRNRGNDGRVQLLMAEVERLTALLRERDGSMEQMQQLAMQLQSRTLQSREWSTKYTQLYETHTSSTRQSKQRLLDYEQKIQQLSQQFEELSTKLLHFRSENEGLRGQLLAIDDLVEKNRVLGAEIDRLNGIVAGLRAQIEEIRGRLGNQAALERRVQEDLAMMVILFAEIETMRNRLMQSEQECENVRRSSLTPHRVDRTVGRSMDARNR